MEGKMFSTSALEYQHRLLCLQGCFFFFNGTWRAAEKMKKTTPPSQTQLLDFAPQACLLIKADPLSK